MTKILTSILVSLMLAGCQVPVVQSEMQSASEPLGEFNPDRDLLISNFDSKPDVDDLHSIAALSSVLRSAPYAEVEYIAVAGAYGVQGGEYIEAPRLFDLAFGDRWLDAHNDRNATIETLATRVIETLDAGGDVWVQDAGQSDVSSDIINQVAAQRPDLDTRSAYHVVQHSEWNESVTSPDKLETLKRHADYRRIPDGNSPGNGTPGFVSRDATLWPAMLGHPELGAVWAEAKAIADARNPSAAYVNPFVAQGGLDFSDTAEIAYILGFDDMVGADDFVAAFIEQ